MLSYQRDCKYSTAMEISSGVKYKECRILYYERDHESRTNVLGSISTQKDSETSLGAEQIKTICS